MLRDNLDMLEKELILCHLKLEGGVVDDDDTHQKSEIDQSTLIGESFPVAKQADSQVWARTVHIGGYIAVWTTAMADNSTMAKMARLVVEAQRLIDTCAKFYTPVFYAGGRRCMQPREREYADHNHRFTGETLEEETRERQCSFYRGKRTPITSMKLGAVWSPLIIKKKSLANIKVVAFSKTGTSTRGEFSVKEFLTADERVPQQVTTLDMGARRAPSQTGFIKDSLLRSRIVSVQRISGEDELKGTKRGYWEKEARWQTPPATSTSAEGNCFVDADRLRDILQEQRHSCQFLFSEALTYQGCYTKC
ncbi:hypothetical protein QYE76_039913 [Lolium multiflorum]|uniref:P-type ATPase A domain-containing protein n=1 Tax=Lolium multiflorum TaxID=4521 RepID=A0AAD8WSL0_LOLMU|nr:hypothetical protein QYE76_039913 [Lolium multiflorum]